MSNNEILLKNLNLINTCIRFQTTKYHLQSYIDDIKAEIYLIILEYDNEKLNTIHRENHMNAFVTGILFRQLYSQTSPFYRKYRKFGKIAAYQLNYLLESETPKMNDN